MFPHLHKFKFDSEMTGAHIHRIFGHTENMIGITHLHFHHFCGISSYNSHTHYYSGYTGLPVKTENGHIHRIEGIIESNNLHEHKFSSFTFEEIEYISGKLSKKVYI